MRTIGVRELKAQLSRVLRDIQAGESYLVTDRGRVVAELRRPESGTYAESRTERALARLAHDGVLRMAESRGGPYAPSPVRLPDGTAQALLAADREER